MSIFEMFMVICFGAAWPFSIFKSYRSRTNKGKSVLFLVVVLLGYLSGVIHKILYNYDAVTYLYLLNGVMVATDIVLYLRNGRLVRIREAAV